MSTETYEPQSFADRDWDSTVQLVSATHYERQTPRLGRKPWGDLTAESRRKFASIPRGVLDAARDAGFLVMHRDQLREYLVESMASFVDVDLDVHADEALAIVDESAVRDA